MLFSLFIIPIAIAVGADLALYMASRKREPRATQRLWIGLGCDLLPVAILLIAMSFDNSSFVMRLAMWCIWGWLFCVIPRLIGLLIAALGWRKTGMACGLLLAAILLYGVVYGRRALTINELTICSPKLPEAFDGYRIAHFTDLHLGTLVNTRGEVRRLVDKINAADPDLVCFTGDLVNIRYSELDSVAAELLRSIKAPVISILGNHDIGSYIRYQEVLSAEESTQHLVERQLTMGWLLLQDSTIYLQRGADSISLTGFSFERKLRYDRHNRQLPLTAAKQAYAGVPDSLYNITLVHVPQLWDQILETGYGDLTLSGHVHAMQLKIGDWSPAQWLFERWSGRYDKQGSTLYINDGIGYVGYPMRLGAPPELSIYTLRRCE